MRGALDTLGARRLAHGVRAIEDEALVARLAVEHVCCDTCPTSNVMLRVVPSMASHPLPLLVAAGACLRMKQYAQWCSPQWMRAKTSTDRTGGVRVGFFCCLDSSFIDNHLKLLERRQGKTI